MKSKKYTKIVLLSIVAFALSACGGSSSKTPSAKEQALSHIEAYAQNGTTAPTVQDYTNAGVTKVNADNIDNINEIIENLTGPEVDTVDEIQALVDAQVAATPMPSQAPTNTPDAVNLKILGKNPTYVQHGRKYVEKGAKASNATVKTKGKVDTSKVGEYLITYTATTKEGKTVSKKRKVIVQPITHHGLSYGYVVSSRTGRVWLDRNMGATSICEKIDDIFDYDDSKYKSCLGDFYQWGRNPDGHQKIGSKVSKVQASGVETKDGKFIDGHDDWSTSTDRSANWRKTDGSSVCPVHYRVPTKEEFEKEIPQSDNKKFFTDTLKMPYAMLRLTTPNAYSKEYAYSVRGEDIWINIEGVWTNTPSNTTHTYAAGIDWYDDYPSYSSLQRSLGIPVRCIQD